MRRSNRTRGRRWTVGVGLAVTIVMLSGSCGGTGGGGTGYLVPSICTGTSTGGCL